MMFTVAQKLTGGQLNLAHGTKNENIRKKLKITRTRQEMR